MDNSPTAAKPTPMSTKEHVSKPLLPFHALVDLPSCEDIQNQANLIGSWDE